jgi:hypothetical protein
LADLNCYSCGYRVGAMGRNTINKNAMIHYNKDGFFTDFKDKNLKF